MTTRRVHVTGEVLAADTGRRTITGRLLPFGRVGNTSAGPVMFTPDGAHDVQPGFVVNLEHDRSRPVGRARTVDLTEDGIDVTIRVAATRRGDDVLVEAADGLRSGLSVEADILDSDTAGDGTLIVTASRVVGAAITWNPAYDDAQVTDVAAATPEELQDAVDTIAGLVSPLTSEDDTPEEETPMTDTPVVDVPAAAATSVEAPRPLYAAARTTPRPQYATLADHLRDQVLASEGDPDARARLTAAAGDVTVSVPGAIVPTATIGDLVNPLNTTRPVVASARQPGLPQPSALQPFRQGGFSYHRPRVKTHTSVAAQSAEFDALSATSPELETIDVTIGSYGGRVKVSKQTLMIGDPSFAQFLFQDLADQYAIVTDNVAADAFATSVTVKTTLAANATSDTIMKALTDGAMTVYAACGEFPDTLYVAPDQWSRLASLVDANKRPLFPYLAPDNAPGSNPGGIAREGLNPLGLSVVLDGNFASGTFIIGVRKYLEVYEDAANPVRMEALTVSTAAVELGVLGLFGSVNVLPAGFTYFAPSG